MKTSPRILVAYKKSRYEQLVIEQGNPRIIDLLERGHVSVRSLKRSHHAHCRSVDKIVDHLDDTGADYQVSYRGEVSDTDGFDLIIAVGGDGTVLDLSHRIESTAIVAINSNPESSVGYFSAGTAHDFPRILESILSGPCEPVQLRRFYTCIDGERRGPPVLNDILVSHANPAAVSYYFLAIGSHPAEAQKSSGVWIASPAGSTAAIRSAGGLVLPYGSDNLQYLVREPFPPRQGGYRFLKGIQAFDDHLEIISRMRQGQVFIDGPHLTFDFPIGSSLTIDPEAPLLTIYGLQQERRVA